MTAVQEEGARGASVTPYDADDAGFRKRVLEILAEHDAALLRDYVDDEVVPPLRLSDALAAQTARGQVHPLFCGSALTGAGVKELTAGIRKLLPPAQATATRLSPVSSSRSSAAPPATASLTSGSSPAP